MAIPEEDDEDAAEVWQTSGHEWIGRRVRTFHQREVADGTIVSWKPETRTVAALWRMEHDDAAQGFRSRQTCCESTRRCQMQ